MSTLGEVSGQGTGPAATAEPEMDRVIERLGEGAQALARTSAAEKARLLRDVQQRLYRLASDLTEAACRAKSITLSSDLWGEELLSGPVATLRYVRLLAQALEDIAARGLPSIPDECFREHALGSAVTVLPIETLDRVRFATISAEVWLGVPPELARHARAELYRGGPKKAAVGLVLGAGNVASIPAMDALHMMFVAGQSCLLKFSPVNEYLGPLLKVALEPLIERGWLAFAYGGPAVGAYACRHPGIDSVHVTGSAETHDRIVWGDEPERSARKQRGEPLLKKHITSELGNVTPVIVPPVEYADRELGHLARSIAGMVAHNASFNCLAAKMLVLSGRWPQRAELLSRVASVLAATPTRVAYYPGARGRYESLVRAAGELRELGKADGERLPWALVTGLDPASDAPHFRTEPFCSVLSEVALPSADADEFLDGAVRFANDKLWGTLNAMVVAPKHLLGDKALGAAVERSVEKLDYGVVCVNAWTGLAFGMSEMPWGAAPGSTLENVRSGIGWAHNALMLEHVQKCVVRAPLTAVPTPLWYPGHRSLRKFAKAFLDYELSPGPLRLAKLVGAALPG